jgi:hypothetical protein
LAGDPPSDGMLAELEQRLWEPGDQVIAALAELPGDLMLLGAGGKIGLSLARMARLAMDRCPGRGRRVIAVSRFAGAGTREEFAEAGVEALPADLSDPAALAGLPDAANVIYLVGRKFGTHGDPWTTWAVNTYLPARVAERFAGSRIVAFSTGNVYPLPRSPRVAPTSSPRPARSASTRSPASAGSGCCSTCRSVPVPRCRSCG